LWQINTIPDAQDRAGGGMSIAAKYFDNTEFHEDDLALHIAA